MDKLELSAYLCNLHTLMEAQSAKGESVASSVLASEYDKHWGLFNQAINEEDEKDERD